MQEQAVQDLIASAQAGELEKRIDTSEYEGFMKSIAEGINNIMDAVLAPTKETIAVSEALSEGDLTTKIEGEYQGMFAELAWL
ncbi:MAG: hypothetical protein Q9N32_06295 [Gammaproteobacteria bacterium]|nr:hypothetical protein [Gammaproteobacteria bacterium]